MTKEKNIIKMACEVIEDHCEQDCETYGVNYFFRYFSGHILLMRMTTWLTGETYSDGGIDTKSHGTIVLDVEEPIEVFCNIAIELCKPTEQLHYDYGYDVDSIAMEKVRI